MVSEVSRHDYLMRIDAKNKKEIVYGLLFLVPYIEPFIGGTWRIGNNAVGRAVVVLELLIIAINVICFFFLKRIVSVHHGIELLFCFFVILMLYHSGLHMDNFSTALCMTVPLLCAVTIHARMTDEMIDCDKVLYYGVYWFTAFLVALIIYNTIYLGRFTSGHRLVAPGGGSVVLGYTLAVYFALVITNKTAFSDKERLFFKLFFTVAAVLTGSRGGVWPIALLWIVDYLRGRVSLKRVFESMAAVALILALNPLDYINRYMPRLLVSSDSARSGSNYGAVKAFQSFDVIDKIIGRGPGDFFPYQNWVNRNVAASNGIGNNNFDFNGITMLVQPHNSVIYVLLELGVIGLLIAVLIIMKNLRLEIKNNRNNRIILIGTIVFVNLFDSIFIVEPGIALVFWLLIFISYSQALGRNQ